MRRGLLLLVGVAFLAMSAPACAATLVGSNLANPANEGSCGFGTFIATERLCVVAQASQTADVAPGGLTVPFDGVIVGWRMKTGTTAADVTDIKVGLRLFHGNKHGASGGIVPFPLGEPGIHSYKARLPVNAGDRIGLDSYTTTNSTLGGDLPVAYHSPGAGVLNQYSSTTGEEPPNITEEDAELLLQAEVEPDADHDGFGDETQDGCPTNPLTQAPCATVLTPPTGLTPPRDLTPPVARSSIATRQDFIELREILIKVTSNEAGTATGSGTLKIKGEMTAYRLPSVTQLVVANHAAKLHVDIPRKALSAAKQALRKRKKVTAVMNVQVTDTAGNAGGITQVVVKPKAAKPQH